MLLTAVVRMLGGLLGGVEPRPPVRPKRLTDALG